MKSPSGFLKNPFDPRDVWLDEVLVAGDQELPLEYRIDRLQFEPQGAWPFCVAFCVTKMSEDLVRRSTGVVKQYSQPHLFFHSGGGPRGSYFRDNLDTSVKKGLVSYETFPMHDSLYAIEEFREEQRRAHATPFVNPDKMSGYVRVRATREHIKRALLEHGPLMVGVYAGGGYWKDGTERKGKVDNHAVLLVGWDKDDRWLLFDSLQPTSDFDGYHYVSANYRFMSVYGLTELPSDWKKKRDEAREAPDGNKNRYGKSRNYPAEVAFAARMMEEFKRFNNESVFAAAGRFWEMYIRAGVYGGYSLSYTKWGKWMPGDIINDCYFWRRTGKHIFDFDQVRQTN